MGVFSLFRKMRYKRRLRHQSLQDGVVGAWGGPPVAFHRMREWLDKHLLRWIALLTMITLISIIKIMRWIIKR